MIFWGTFFPLISELFTGNKASLAAPWFDRYTTPLAILLVLFTGIGPLLAWRRVSWASAKRVFRVPLAVAGGRRGGAGAASPTPPHKPWALRALRLRRLRPDRPGAGVLDAAPRRGASSPAARCRRRWSRVVSRNRRRYGGYIVHVGIAVLLIGIAASSSFQTNRDVTLRPGESAVVDGRTITYVKPTVSVDERDVHASARVLRVEEGRQDASTPAPEPPLLPPDRRQATGTIASYFDGEATSEVGLEAGLGSDLWIADAAGHRRRAAAGARGRQGLRSLRQRRARDAAAVQSAGGADARRRRQPEPAPGGAGADRQAAGR